MSWGEVIQLLTLAVNVLIIFRVELVHKLTNSMKDQLVATTSREKYSEGRIAGRAEAKAEGDQDAT